MKIFGAVLFVYGALTLCDVCAHAQDNAEKSFQALPDPFTPLPEAVAPKEQNDQKPAADFGLEQVWTADGKWVAVATGADKIYAKTADRHAVQFTAAGEWGRPINMPDDGNLLRSANLIAGADPELLTFSVSGRAVIAYDTTGKQLWRYSVDRPIDDVCAADLNGDGLDEVIVGHHTTAGVHVLKHDGLVLWKDDGLSKVWHVAAGDVNGDAKPDVVTTSASGEVHVFDSIRQKRMDVLAGCKARMVRVVPAEEKGMPDWIIAYGLDREEVKSVPYVRGNDERWSVRLKGPLSSAEATRSRSWLAVTGAGRVLVIDAPRGKTIAQQSIGRVTAQVAWLESAGQPPLLLIANGENLAAYRITGH